MRSRSGSAFPPRTAFRNVPEMSRSRLPKRSRRAAKRAIDIFVALAALVVTAPVAVLVAIAIRIDSGGPIFFSQWRLGQWGDPIRIYKFRKFRDDPYPSGPAVTVDNDSRMTAVGKFLERWKLDELPQLWNMLIGDISLVGPRPESFRFADCFIGPYQRILDHQPGIFGPNQALFRSERRLYPPGIAPEQFYREVLFPLKARVDLTYFAQSNPLRHIRWIRLGLLAILFQSPLDKSDDWAATVETWIREPGL